MSNNDLFDLISSRKWDQVIARVHNKPSDASQRMISFMSMGSEQANLALHEACKNQPPVKVIDKLLKANPEAIKVKGQWGYLPLHYACSSGASCEVVAKLVEAFAQGARAHETHEGFLPLHLACKWGSQEGVILEVLTRYPEAAYEKDSSGQTPMDHANALSESSGRRMGVIKALGFAPTLCAVSRATEENVRYDSEVRLEQMAKEHAQELDAKYELELEEARIELETLTSDLNCEKNKHEMLKHSHTEQAHELERARTIKATYKNDLTEAQDQSESLRNELSRERERSHDLDRALKKAQEDNRETISEKEQDAEKAAEAIDDLKKDLKETCSIMERQSNELKSNKMLIETLKQDLKTKEDHIVGVIQKKEQDAEQTAALIKRLELSFESADKERKELQAVLEAERIEGKTSKEKQRQDMQDVIDVAHSKINGLEVYPSMFESADKERKELSAVLESERKESRTVVHELKIELSTEKSTNKTLAEELKDKREYIDQILQKKEHDDEEAATLIKGLEASFESAVKERKELEAMLKTERVEAKSARDSQRLETQGIIDAANTKIQHLEGFPSMFESADKERKQLSQELKTTREEARTALEEVRSKLETREAELKSCQNTIQHLTDSVSELEEKNGRMEKELKAEKESFEDLLFASDSHKREFNKVTADFKEIVRCKDVSMEQLMSQLEAHRNTEVALAGRVITYEQMRQEASQDLNRTLAQLSEARKFNGDLQKKFNAAQQTNEAYDQRIKQMKKWITSLFHSVESWDVTNDWKRNGADSDLNLMTLFTEAKPGPEAQFDSPASKEYETDSTESASVKMSSTGDDTAKSTERFPSEVEYLNPGM